MSSIENKFIAFLQKHDVILGFFTVTIIGVILRISMYPHITGDYKLFLREWVEQLRMYPGLSGIGKNIGEYNVPYMLFLNIAARLPFKDLYVIKTLSVLFDYIGSISAVCLISKIRNTRLFTPINLIAYTVLLFTPVVFINSAYWAQCDFIYVSFLLLSTLFLVKDKYSLSIIFFGVAFALKLQAVFFLPVLLIYYFASKKISILQFLWIPVVFIISDLPAIIAGRGIINTLSVYISQTTLYDRLTLNCPNILVFFPGESDVFFTMGIAVTFLFFMFAAFVCARQGIEDKKKVILIALWSGMVCIYFLPAMHERYAFIACIFSIVWAFIYKKDWWIAVGINLVTILSSTFFLFGVKFFELQYLAIANLVFFIAISIRLFIKYPKQPEISEVK